MHAEARRQNAWLVAGIAEMARRTPLIVKARGLGLLLAVEFDPCLWGMAPGEAFAGRRVEARFSQGLSTTSKRAGSSPAARS